MAAPDSRPNIIFLLADDQSYWSMGCTGHPLAKTPNLDRLAADGVIFDAHYDSSPICMASRATIATGLYEYRTGCNFEHGRMTPEMFGQSYHCQLRQAGYFVGYAGKLGFGIEYEGLPSNPPHDYRQAETMPADEFDWWRGLPGQGDYETARNPTMAAFADAYPHLTRALGASAEEFLDQAAESGKPFCLSIGFKAPHDPPRPDPVFDAVYRGVDFPRPLNYGQAGAAHVAPHVRTGRQWVLFDQEWAPEMFSAKYRNYFQLIHGVDCAVGMVRDALRERGLDRNTVIIYSSDNGYFCGSHRLGGKVLLYEEGSRVPLIVYDPRRRHCAVGRRIGALTVNADLAPTIRELAGLPARDDLDGVSLIRHLDDDQAVTHDCVSLMNFWNMPPTQGLSVTDGRWKYLFYWFQGQGMLPTEELYDLRTDPAEMVNLASDPAVAADLRRLRECYDRAVAHIREHAVPGRRYEHYAALLERGTPWREKQACYAEFFDRWVRTGFSWRGGTWFEDLDLSDFPEEVTYCFGRRPGTRRQSLPHSFVHGLPS